MCVCVCVCVSVSVSVCVCVCVCVRGIVRRLKRGGKWFKTKSDKGVGGGLENA